MIIIRRLLVLLLIVISASIVANADDNKSYKCEGNTYSSTGRVKSNSSALVPTGFEWTDSKGIKYLIYISASGSCYIIKKSNKTGKEYKQYLKPEISQDICKKLGKEYKGKKMIELRPSPFKPGKCICSSQ